MDALAESPRTIGSEPVVAEADWRRWLRAAPIAPLDWRSRSNATHRLVIVAPHPDDEILACGGLLALQIAAGGEALVVAVTDGEASHAGNPAWPAGRLAATRRDESRRGLGRIGAAEVETVRLALPDGQVAAQRDRLGTCLQTLLHEGDLVVTTWRFDGHPDHEATGAATAAACREVGSRLVEAPVWAWHWSAPGDARLPWRRLRAVALPSEVLRRKAAAIAEHATQLAPRAPGVPPVLGASILARAARSAEYFFMPERP
jgi:LmbE family N-acetylglucosaminyl deacetylase